ncbi:hypothetical protein IVB33_22300 [Bradyrhizobium sp. 24]|uniref:hypothetical protein n=1 Tax=unclassified Bradyrhizobium TaxID=2631580 RepID=UPI001FFAC55C|nr:MULTISPECIES: hypothetical protein [unclassified Bradyrhizobium]MCK1300479.1 hypothetical protein [Bradyrhizobium sp. 37]MCK1380048.1 hypothetical protein [Bradyrhizobium sp. 24]MCK1772314.1 hypothetical protein [Bradyrhizobium sp. 134]
MNYSSAFRWSIAAVLLLTIGWKIASQPETQNYLKDDLIKFFERNHFNVVVTDEVVNYTPIIRASRASCHLQIATLIPDGSNRDLIRHLAAGTDRSFVVFRGTVYVQQPVFWTVLDYFWSKFLRELGLIKHITPVISVAVNSSCNGEGLPWGELEGIRRDPR